jgi:hypothetical protein
MKRKIPIAVFFATIMLLIPLTTVVGNSTQQLTEENNDIILPFIIDTDKITHEQEILILESALEELSKYYADSPDFQKAKIDMEEQILFMEQNGEWDFPIFCSLLVFFIICAALLKIGQSIEIIYYILQLLAEGNFEGAFDLWVVSFIVKGKYGALAVTFGLFYVVYCMDIDYDISEYASTITTSNILDTGEISTLTIQYPLDCGCT